MHGAMSFQMNGVPGGGGGVAGGKKKSVPRGPTDKQIEARTPDGRRRITPIFIPPNSAEFNDNNDDNTYDPPHTNKSDAETLRSIKKLVLNLITIIT